MNGGEGQSRITQLSVMPRGLMRNTLRINLSGFEISLTGIKFSCTDIPHEGLLE